MTPWRRLSSRLLLKDRWLTLRSDTCELPNGKTIEPYYVLEENEWAHVFAIDEQQRVLVVRQYRHAAGIFCSELPGGVIDRDELPLAAAQRELLEETGFVADEWVPVATAFANPARQTNRIHLFLARGLRGGAAQALDESEEISFSLRSVPEIKALIASGEFAQAMHIASFYLGLEAALEGRRPPEGGLSG